MHPRTPFDISRLATAVMLACVGLNVSATSSQSVGVVTGRQVTVAGKPEIEYVRTQNRVQVKTLPTHSDLDDDPLSDWRYVWKIDGVEVKAEANASSASTIPVHPILQDQYNKPATLCLKAVTSRGYPEETRTSAETCSDAVQLTNAAATVTNVSVTGTLKVGQELTVGFSYSDADGDSASTGISGTANWYRSDDAAGSNKTIITGVPGDRYTLVDADGGKYLSASIAAAASTGLSGSRVESPLVGPIVARLWIERVTKPDSVQQSWTTANQYCINRGWRLPTLAELQALYKENPSNAMTNVHGWPNGNYWTGSLYSTNYYHAINFNYGGSYHYHEINNLYVTCVR